MTKFKFFIIKCIKFLIQPIERIIINWIRWKREYLNSLMLFDIVMGFIADCKIEGCYLEFGAADGDSLVKAYHAASRYQNLKTMEFYVFDSFEGLPEPKGVDTDGLKYKKGDFACDVESYKKNIIKKGVDLNRVKCIPGWYNDVLNQELKKKLPIKKAAVVLIDCDLYESTVPVLDFITDYMQNGTILIFDDWFSFKGRLDRGEAKAFNEWLIKNPSITAKEYHKFDRTIVSFILNVN